VEELEKVETLEMAKWAEAEGLESALQAVLPPLPGALVPLLIAAPAPQAALLPLSAALPHALVAFPPLLADPPLSE